MALPAALFGGVSVCLPPSAASLEVTFCTVGDKTRESGQGLPALCKAVNEKSARKSQELLGSNLCHHYLLLGGDKGAAEGV